MNNWERVKELQVKARLHTEEMENKYGGDFGEIRACVEQTKIYGGEESYPAMDIHNHGSVRSHVMKNTTTGALFNLTEEKNGKIAVLNFASYTAPGGMFMEGSSAQEESLCHASYLYNVLREFKDDYYAWNNNHKNKGLYLNRALYSPKVAFFDEQGKEYLADVITCAAPNRSILEKYGSFTEQENLSVLSSRIEFIRDICLEQKVDTVVLGAWGCGVFRQDPETVARLFNYLFEHTGMTVVYAIPDDKTYEVFAEEIHGGYLIPMDVNPADIEYNAGR